MDEFIKALQYIRSNDGQLPPTLNSIQDGNELGESGVPDEVVQKMGNEAVEQSLLRDGTTDTILCLVDGFLLYSDPGVIDELDLRLLVRAPYDKLKARREARSGYVTLEGNLLYFLEQEIMSRILGRSASILRQNRLEVICQRSQPLVRKRRRKWHSERAQPPQTANASSTRLNDARTADVGNGADIKLFKEHRIANGYHHTHKGFNKDSSPPVSNH